MKIVLITPYWLQTKGGITSVVYHLANELQKIKLPIHIFSPDGGTGIIKLPRNRFLLPLKTIKMLQKVKPNVIHIHGHGSLLLGPVVYKKLLNKCVKIIFTFHTQPHTQSFLTGKPAKERGVIKQTIVNILLNYCDFTTYVSQSLMESLQRIGVKIINPVVIQNGVMAKNTSSEEIKKFEQNNNLEGFYPILCMVASLVWDWKAKGVEILIRAFKEILKDQSRARLIIVGDGKFRKNLEDYTEKEGLTYQVIFVGNMDNPFIALSTCDIYCHISLNEAFPVAPLEAMITGKPIIASNDGGLPEIIINGYNGLLVESRFENVSKAILNLCKNPELIQSLSKNALSSAQTKYSWEKITREYIKLYEG